jgi:hypothetical protein
MKKEQTLENRLKTEYKRKFHRIEEIKKWPDRLAKLESEAAFCDKYHLSKGQFNKTKNLLRMPSQKYFDKVEKALRKEGV